MAKLPNKEKHCLVGQYQETEKLDRYDHHSILLSNNENFLIVDKPSNLRMNGNFDCTVEKLIYHLRKDLSDNNVNLKWIHQLDYATSGVLCVGLNRPAAAIASYAFETRQVTKKYLAVLQGHINTNNFVYADFEHRFNGSSNDDDINSNNNNNIKRDSIITEKKRKYSQDPSSTWQTEVMSKNLDLCLLEFGRIMNEMMELESIDMATIELSTRQKSILTNRNIIQELTKYNPENYKTNAKARKKLRKLLKNCQSPIDFVESSNKTSSLNILNDDNDAIIIEKEPQNDVNVSNENEFHVKYNNTTTIDIDNCLSFNQYFYDSIENSVNNGINMINEIIPIIYRRKNIIDNNSILSSTNLKAKEILVINIPIADIENDFRMQPGNKDVPGRVAMTELEVLEYGYYKGFPVTKVQLYPKTGRRHQLRVHCLCIGHPIVGDFTYNSYHRKIIEINDCSKEAERMMLHAHYLRIPNPIGYPLKQEAQNFRHCLSNLNTIEIAKASDENNDIYCDENLFTMVDIKSNDPFLFKEGVLCLSN
eukprot:gene10366-13927_t